MISTLKSSGASDTQFPTCFYIQGFLPQNVIRCKREPHEWRPITCSCIKTVLRIASSRNSGNNFAKCSQHLIWRSVLGQALGLFASGTDRHLSVQSDHPFCTGWHSEATVQRALKSWTNINISFFFLKVTPNCLISPSLPSALSMSDSLEQGQFSGRAISPNFRANAKPWSCLVKILQINSALGRVVLPKWMPRTRLFYKDPRMGLDTEIFHYPAL